NDSRTDSSSSITEMCERASMTSSSREVLVGCNERRDRGRTCACHRVGLTGNRERERGARTVIQPRPDSSTLALDDGAAHKPTGSHTTGLGGEKGCEQFLRVADGEADPVILHGQAHITTFITFSSDDQLAWTIVDIAHGLRGVQEEVEHHLLQLDAVAND